MELQQFSEGFAGEGFVVLVRFENTNADHPMLWCLAIMGHVWAILFLLLATVCFFVHQGYLDMPYVYSVLQGAGVFTFILGSFYCIQSPFFAHC